jgi:hypothetical protein
VWAIDPWSRLSRQPVVRSPEFGLAGSERTWMLSYTHDKLGFHLTCVGEALSSACMPVQHAKPAWRPPHAVLHMLSCTLQQLGSRLVCTACSWLSHSHKRASLCLHHTAPPAADACVMRDRVVRTSGKVGRRWPVG